MELVVSPHRVVAELGVIGRAEHMHLIMDAERDATLDYLDQVTRQVGGRRGRIATADRDRRAGVCPHPPCHVTGGRPVPARSCAAGERGPDARWPGRVEGGGHRLVAGAFARRHHGGPGGGGPGSGRVGLRHRGRSGPVRAAAPLAHRRRSGRGDRSAFEASGGDRRRMRTAGRALLTGPGGGRPGHPPGQRTWPRGRAGGPLAGRGGVGRMARRTPRGSHRRRWPGGRTAPEVGAEGRCGGCSARYSRPRGNWPGGRCFPAAICSSNWPPTCSARTPRCSICSWVGPSRIPK